MNDALVTALQREAPFVVEQHAAMSMRVAGKGETVLTLERMFYAWRICEYTDPLFIGRGWWYEDDQFGDAVAALFQYLEVAAATEPQGWLRADDFDDRGWPRCRRAHVEFGERVITVDGEE